MQRGEGSGAERGRSRQGSALPKLGTCTLPVPWRDSSGLWGGGAQAALGLWGAEATTFSQDHHLQVPVSASTPPKTQPRQT